jgi:hypothetical protein
MKTKIICKFINLKDESKTLEYELPSGCFPIDEEKKIQKQMGPSWILSDRLDECIQNFNEIGPTQKARREFGYGYGCEMLEITEENIKALKNGQYLAYYNLFSLYLWLSQQFFQVVLYQCPNKFCFYCFRSPGKGNNKR